MRSGWSRQLNQKWASTCDQIGPVKAEYRRCALSLVLVCLCMLFLLCRSEPARAQEVVRLPASISRQSDTPHIPPQAIAYQKTRRLITLAATGWEWLGFWVLLTSGISAWLRAAVYRITRRQEPEGDRPPPFRALFLYYLVFTLLMLLWALLPGLASWTTEHRYGFSHQNLSGYLQDVGLNYLLNLFTVLLVWGGYRLYAASPQRWWLWSWGIMAPMILFFMVIQPVVIAPLYNHYTPLKPGPTRDHLLSLAAKAGISGANVYVEDTSKRTTHVNAYVTGVGPTTRIVLNDTALQSLSEDELLAVMGHEMGHYVEGHIWFLTALSIVVTFVFLLLLSRLLPLLASRGGRALRLHGVTDLAALPMIFLVISLFMFLTEPAINGVSRIIEHRADIFGLRLTHLNEPMIQAFVGFAERDYSDPDPPALWQFWYGSHPTLKERITFARSYPGGKD